MAILSKIPYPLGNLKHGGFDITHVKMYGPNAVRKLLSGCQHQSQVVGIRCSEMWPGPSACPLNHSSIDGEPFPNNTANSGNNPQGKAWLEKATVPHMFNSRNSQKECWGHIPIVLFPGAQVKLEKTLVTLHKMAVGNLIAYLIPNQWGLRILMPQFPHPGSPNPTVSQKNSPEKYRF